MENSSLPEINSSCADCTGRGHGSLNTSTTPLSSRYYITVPVILSVICAVGLTGNTAVTLVILNTKDETVTNIFILNLAIADKLFTLVLPINIAEHLLLQPCGELMCKLIISIDQCNTFSSIYFLTAMSTDCYPFVAATTECRRVSHHTYRAAKAVSLCWSFVTVIICLTVFAKIHKEQRRSQWVFMFPHPESVWWKGSTLILGFVIPVPTICTLYTTMLCRLRQVHLHCNAKALEKAKIKVTLMVVGVLRVCLFCWIPFRLSTVVTLIMDIPQTPLVIGLSYFVTSLSYGNSCLSPFLYAFLDDSLWRRFCEMIDHRTTP
ncbi:LOW QUALITY PROTEIN: neuropeptides B/W receptor type 1 [Sylvia borin]